MGPLTLLPTTCRDPQLSDSSRDVLVLGMSVFLCLYWQRLRTEFEMASHGGLAFRAALREPALGTVLHVPSSEPAGSLAVPLLLGRMLLGSGEGSTTWVPGWDTQP